MKEIEISIDWGNDWGDVPVIFDVQVEMGLIVSITERFDPAKKMVSEYWEEFINKIRDGITMFIRQDFRDLEDWIGWIISSCSYVTFVPKVIIK